MNATQQQPKPEPGFRSEPEAAPNGTAMRPVDEVLALVDNAPRIDEPWFWRDRWAD